MIGPSISLGPDETIIWEARRSLWLYQPSLVIIPVCMFFGLYLLFTGADAPVPQGYAGICCTILLSLCAIFALRLYVLYEGTRIILTNRRVIFSIGYFRRNVDELYLNRIEGVNVKQTFSGRVMDYGTVEASGVGNEVAPVYGIADPWAFHRAVSAAMGRVMAADGNDGQGGRLPANGGARAAAAK